MRWFSQSAFLLNFTCWRWLFYTGFFETHIFQMSLIKWPISVLQKPLLSLDLFISLSFLFDLQYIDCWECTVKGKTSSITIHPASFFKGGKKVDLNYYAYIFVNSDKVWYAGYAHSCSAKETSFLDWSLYLAVRHKRKYFSLQLPNHCNLDSECMLHFKYILFSMSPWNNTAGAVFDNTLF